MPDKKEFTVDVDEMLNMHVKRASVLQGFASHLIKMARLDVEPPTLENMPVIEMASELMQAATEIERGVLEDYFASRGLGGDDASPDLQMIAEYLAKNHVDDLEEGQTIGQAVVGLLKNLKTNKDNMPPVRVLPGDGLG